MRVPGRGDNSGTNDTERKFVSESTLFEAGVKGQNKGILIHIAFSYCFLCYRLFNK